MPNLERGNILWDLLKWPLLVIVGLWLLWYFTGGPARVERREQEGSNPTMKQLHLEDPYRLQEL